jgi:hypothetical protein
VNPLDARLELRLTQAEKLAWKAEAAAAGVDVSTHVRRRMRQPDSGATPIASESEPEQDVQLEQPDVKPRPTLEEIERLWQERCRRLAPDA